MNRTDKNGNVWVWAATCFVVGGVIGAAAKVVSNVSTGKKWNEGILGAFAGGATAGAVFAVTGNSSAAAFVGAFAESAVNEIASYNSKTSKWNGQSSTKKITSKNVSTSVQKVGYETVLNGVIGSLTGNLAERAVYVNPKWFKPQKIKTCLTGNYAKKLSGQTVIQSGYGIGVSIMMDLEGFVGVGQSSQNGVVALYPIMQVGPAR